MSSKFAANLSFMFTESASIIGRYELAKQAGFKAVESGFPLGFTKEQVVEAKTKCGVKQVLINVYTGDVTKGELGFAAIPNKEQDFKNSIDLTIDYAKALDCKKIHIMSGKVPSPTFENDTTYENNLRYAAKKFESEGILGLIEPINKYSVPGYFMNNFEKGLSFVKKINSPKLKLMLDVFHLQHIGGNLTNTIREFMPFIGHVQIAQAPHRHEPDVPGEIDYRYLLSVLEKEGYNDYIGLEYKPKTGSVEGLKWIANFGYSL